MAANTERYEMGWNDFIGTIIIHPKYRKKYIDRFSSLTDMTDDYTAGAKAAAETVNQNKPAQYLGPQWIIDRMNEKAPISELYSG